MNSNRRKITVKDLRPNPPREEYCFLLQDSGSCVDLYAALTQKIMTKEFVICLPNRTELTEENYRQLPSGQVLNVLQHINQKVSGIVKYDVNIAPHPDTITKSGMYEYYDSRGIDSVVISIAELIDNSLAATKNNKDLRLIEVRYYDCGPDSVLAIVDNGHGMDAQELTDWAKFKYSKFARNKVVEANSEELGGSGRLSVDSGTASFCSADLPLRPNRSSTPAPRPEEYRSRYLDSNINYFGAGGKQAIFNIGETTTMISKPAKKSADDVFELTLSKEQFDCQSISDPNKVYIKSLIQRCVGTPRNLDLNPKPSEAIEDSVIEEMEKDFHNFSICCIRDILKRHQTLRSFVSEKSTNWTKSLARIYHYYLHGPNGNTGKQQTLPPELRNIKIFVKIFDVKKTPDGGVDIVLKNTINLKDINDDFESQLVRSSADVFDFEMEHMDRPNTKIEGIIRYHPYLHDSETLPSIPINEELGETNSQFSTRTKGTEINTEDEEDLKPSRMREVFECFWHGRLIPQDCIDFEWNKYDKRAGKEIEECYRRLSGALFTNCAYQVSQNKQSFMDLRKMLAKNDHLTFFRVVNGHRVRNRIEFVTQFRNWITECHRDYDKQVKYEQYSGEVSKTQVQSLMKRYPRTDTFTVFDSIDWRNKKWKKGDKIKTKNTKPSNLIGIIERFLVPMRLSADVDYTGSPGVIEIVQIPSEIYGKGGDASKFITFTQINFDVNEESINEELDKIYDRLPKDIEISFPVRFGIKSGDVIPAGRTIGDIKVILKNGKGEELKTDRIPYKSANKKLSVQLEILKVEADGQTETEIAYDIANYSKQWESYWFLQKENAITTAGKYRIVCVCLNISTSKDVSAVFADETELPSAKHIDFTVTSGPPKRFLIVDRNPRALIGEPMDLTLELFDEFDNLFRPESITDLDPLLTMSDFNVGFNRLVINGNKVVVKNIIILGQINPQNQNAILEIYLPSLQKKQEVTIALQTGNPSNICITPEQQLQFINGSVPEFGALLLYDNGGNDVSFVKRQQVFCKILEIKQNGQKAAVTPELLLVEGMYDNKRCLILDKEFVITATDISFDSRVFWIKFYLKTDPRVHLENRIVVKKVSKPALIKLYFTNTVNGGSEAIEIPNFSENLEFPAGSALSGVFFRAFDCDGTEIDLAAFENQTLTATWFKKPVLINANGMLPQIPIHTNSGEQRRHRLNWRQLKKNIDLEHTFCLQPFADSPDRLTISAENHPKKFPIGQIVPNPINVSVLDSYNNPILSTDVMNRIIVKPVSQYLTIDDKSLKKVVPKTNIHISNMTSFVFSNFKLLPTDSAISSDESVIGETKLEFTVRGIEGIRTYLDITVVNGTPHSLKWLNTRNNCTTLTNNRRLHLETQLCDEFNNPIIDSSKLSVRLVLGEIFSPNVITAETDERGIATFSDIIHIDWEQRRRSICEIPSELRRDLELSSRCQSMCFGFHKIFCFVRYKQKTIKSMDYWLHIQCDTNNATKISIRYVGPMKVVANESTMPDFTVKVYGEDDIPIRNFDSGKLSMRLIRGESEEYVEFRSPEHRGDLFLFRIDRAPVLPNIYKVKIICSGIKPIEQTLERHIQVVPGPPVKLKLRSEPLKVPIVVSNQFKRIIIPEESPLTLDLVDRNDISIYCENISESDLDRNPRYSGYLSARIVRSDNYCDFDEREGVPELEGCDERKQVFFDITKGKVTINTMLLKENTPGMDGQVYRIELRATLNDSSFIDTFKIDLMFCNETEKSELLSQIQSECLSFTQQRDEIINELKEKKKIKENQKQKYLDSRLSENSIITKLNRIGENSDLSDYQKIRSKISEYRRKFDQLSEIESKRVTRGSNISSVVQREGVFGRIAELVFVSDKKLSKSISWFLRNHMKCVVTKTSELAEQIIGQNEIESALPLEQIPQLPVPSHLPHKSSDPNNRFSIHYYIEYAWNVLIEERNEKTSISESNLRLVLTSILSDTLVADNMEEAKTYRNKVMARNGRQRCPTIVTKNGILFDNGIIDRSCPKEDNTIVMFQSPPNKEFLKAEKVLDLLKDLLKKNNDRVRENLEFEKLSKEFEEIENEKRSQISVLETSIDSSRIKFTEISGVDVMEEESNHSIASNSSRTHSRRNSDNSYRRRRSGSSHSIYSDSDPNPKRPRRL